MKRVILLDAGPLGLVSNPSGSAAAEACSAWFEELLIHREQIIIPEIADYEVRRKLLRAEKTAGLQRLDELKTAINYLPVTTEAMLLAAQFWADARRQGRPTAADPALDGDVILAAQCVLLQSSEVSPVIATTNVGHLSRYATALRWQDIRPQPGKLDGEPPAARYRRERVGR